jgi:hypothetical protein
MAEASENKNNEAWEKLFKKYDIINKIEVNGLFNISSSQIKEYREPRLMAKFDNSVNLPKIFIDNQLAILPITRGDYVISHFKAYHTFNDDNSPIIRTSLPAHIQSLNPNNIHSEAMALNCASASCIIAEFLQDEDLVPTVSGRMSSGNFIFNILNIKNNNPYKIQVSNSQMEIDAAYEGVNGLAIFEAKLDLSEDFLIRQLYYPFRALLNHVAKPIRLIFLIFSNGIYRLYEYAFQDKNNYNSLTLINQKKYSVEDITIKITDIQKILHNTKLEQEEQIPFPQADSFDRVINICELLKERELSRNDITEQYAFDVRQTNYYTDAARYLGLLEKRKDEKTPVYVLSDKGKKIYSMSYKQRQLAYCESILSHKPFSETLKKYFETGIMPNHNEITLIMKSSKLHKVKSDTTFNRRSSTIRSWIEWIIGIINE